VGGKFFATFALLLEMGNFPAFFNILGPTGFDSEINDRVSMPSYGINARKYLFQPFKWRK